MGLKTHRRRALGEWGLHRSRVPLVVMMASHDWEVLPPWWVVRSLSLYFCSALSGTDWKRRKRNFTALNILKTRMAGRGTFSHCETKFNFVVVYSCLLSLINSFIGDSETFFTWRAFYWFLLEADGIIILNHNYVMFLTEAKYSFLRPEFAFHSCLYFQPFAQFPAHISEVFHKCLWNKWVRVFNFLVN